jgi:myo-inositol 2-dehydrogenase/D-chiro-inositol 1-dehydrogenase
MRIAVLGCGRIGQLHADVLTHRIKGASVAVVYDAEPTVAMAVAEATGCRVARSASEAIHAEDVEVVAICTPTDTHVSLIEEAVRAQRDIFCEKPIALNLPDIDRVLASVDDAGVQLHVGLNRRFDPTHRAVAERVAAGEVGDVHLIRITSRDSNPPPISYIEQSGGLFLDMTIHDFDMALYVTKSDVMQVFATAAVRVDPAIGQAGDVDTAVTVLTHENGAITTIDNSRRAVYGYDQRLEVFGSGGSISSGNLRVDSTQRWTAAGSQESPLQHFFLQRYLESYVAEWNDFISAIRSGSPVPVPGIEGRACVAIALAAGLSLCEGRPVTIDDPGLGVART